MKYDELEKELAKWKEKYEAQADAMCAEIGAHDRDSAELNTQIRFCNQRIAELQNQGERLMQESK